MKKDSSKSERKGLQDSSETSYVVGFGDSGIAGKTGERAGGGG